MLRLNDKDIAELASLRQEMSAKIAKLSESGIDDFNNSLTEIIKSTMAVVDKQAYCLHKLMNDLNRFKNQGFGVDDGDVDIVQNDSFVSA